MKIDVVLLYWHAVCFRRLPGGVKVNCVQKASVGDEELLGDLPLSILE